MRADRKLCASGCGLDVRIHFTDAEGEFPPEPPRHPLVWLVKGKARVPWGSDLQLN